MRKLTAFIFTFIFCSCSTFNTELVSFGGAAQLAIDDTGRELGYAQCKVSSHGKFEFSSVILDVIDGRIRKFPNQRFLGFYQDSLSVFQKGDTVEIISTNTGEQKFFLSGVTIPTEPYVANNFAMCSDEMYWLDGDRKIVSHSISTDIYTEELHIDSAFNDNIIWNFAVDEEGKTIALLVSEDNRIEDDSLRAYELLVANKIGSKWKFSNCKRIIYGYEFLRVPAIDFIGKGFLAFTEYENEACILKKLDILKNKVEKLYALGGKSVLKSTMLADNLYLTIYDPVKREQAVSKYENMDPNLLIEGISIYKLTKKRKVHYGTK